MLGNYAVSQEERIDPMSARQIVEQYGNIFTATQKARIATQLVGKYRTSGALNPKQALFASRFLDLSEISQRLSVNPEQDQDLEQEAADTMLAGGQRPRSKGTRRRKRSAYRRHSRSRFSRN